MRESFLEIKIMMLVVMLSAGSRLTVAQDNSKKRAEWEARTVAQMSDQSKRQYERLKKPSFAQLELLPRLLESSESPEAQIKPYKVGDDIFFRLLITNTSSEKVGFSTADPFYYNRPLLLRDGESVPYRDHVVELLKSREEYPDERSVRGPTLPPHETHTEIIELKRWYGPLQPGRYLLTVKRRFIWGGEWIESPSLTFEVIPHKSRSE